MGHNHRPNIEITMGSNCSPPLRGGVVGAWESTNKKRGGVGAWESTIKRKGVGGGGGSGHGSLPLGEEGWSGHGRIEVLVMLGCHVSDASIQTRVRFLESTGRRTGGDPIVVYLKHIDVKIYKLYSVLSDEIGLRC